MLALALLPQHARAALPTIALQPLGTLDPRVARAVCARVRSTFAAEVVLLPAKPLPSASFYRPRMRYRGERIIDWLEATKPREVTKILGLMSSDLSVTKGRVYDWGVMGVAGLSRAPGVVSTHRLGGRSVSSELMTKRACQVSVHELGHTFGLPHCSTPGCIMNAAEGGIAAVDHSSGEFCPHCRALLGELLR